MSDEKPRQFTSSSEQWRKLKPHARRMRHTPTSAEDALWQHLRNRRLNGAKFRRQHGICGFIVDFACIASKLVIEVDGIVHEDPDQQLYDVERQNYLEGAGFQVLRFSNGDVLQSIDAVLERIGEVLNEIPQPESSSGEERFDSLRVNDAGQDSPSPDGEGAGG